MKYIIIVLSVLIVGAVYASYSTMPVAAPMVVALPVNSDKPMVNSYLVQTTAVVVAGASHSRKAMRIYNNSSNSVYLSAGTTCNSSTTLFAIVPTFAAFEFSAINYTGAVCAIRNSGTGNVVVTEFY